MIENDLRRFYLFDRVNIQLTETYHERARINKKDTKRERDKKTTTACTCVRRMMLNQSDEK